MLFRALLPLRQHPCSRSSRHAAPPHGQRLKIWRFSRQSGQTTEREVSPQRLAHYRDSWYLDAWCHLRDDLRSFSIDAVPRLEILATAAKDVSKNTIDETVGVGYGIFKGTLKAWATLRFTLERARWGPKRSDTRSKKPTPSPMEAWC